MTLHQHLTNILAGLRAIHWNAWVTHWKSAGPTAYSDHRLFQRIYEGTDGGPDIDTQTDGLGERVIALFGQAGVDEVAVLRKATQALSEVRGLHALERALKLEAQLLLQITAALKLCGDNISLDNFLRTVADERSTVIYLLRQRIHKE